ncbi:MAG: 2Fe-2S iron-sulfur cluster-binding protein [Planctomycetota bacterium]
MPQRPYTLTILPVGRTIEVDPAQLPYSRDGLPGSVLEIALGHGVEIDHACGGVVACSTCHVVVKEGFETCNEATEDEEDQLDHAPGLTTKSRLACQCVLGTVRRTWWSRCRVGIATWCARTTDVHLRGGRACRPREPRKVTSHREQAPPAAAQRPIS